MDTRDISKEFIKFIIKLKKLARLEINKCNKREINAPNMTMQQFRTMITLKNAGKSGLKELSKKTHVSNSSLCIMLNKLCSDGFVYREIDANDRRNTFYELTLEGNRVLDEELENRLVDFDRLINKLNYEKKEILYKCLIEIEDIVDELNSN